MIEKGYKMENSNDKLLNYMKQKPDLYEASFSAFWNDEHISKFMLEAHLNPDFGGASRKYGYIQQSVNWIAEYCKDGNGKKLLDLGCGPGIYADLLTDRGFCVTGIDFSERSIKYAKQHAADSHKTIKYCYQNYLEMDYTNEFDVIILIYCDFGVLPPKDRNLLLKKIHQALKTNGILILDGFTALNHFSEKETIEYQGHGFWSEYAYVAIHRNFIYKDTDNTLEQHVIVTKDDCACYNIWNQLYSKETLENEIRTAGFSDTDYFDNVLGEVFTGQESTICVVAKK